LRHALGTRRGADLDQDVMRFLQRVLTRRLDPEFALERSRGETTLLLEDLAGALQSGNEAHTGSFSASRSP